MLPAFHHYYEDLKKRFHQLYNDLLHDCEVETVHQFRLNLKRQLGFYKLLQILFDDFRAEEAFAQYIPLYKMAGKVRDIQVEKKVVGRDEDLLLMEKRFTLWLEEKEQDRIFQLQQLGATSSLALIHELEEQVTQKLMHLSPALLEERLPQYFSRQIKSLQQHLKRKRRLALHDLRKEVKELYYNLQLLDQLLEGKRLPKKTMSSLDLWQQILGRWHDYDFILNRIRQKREPCPKVVRKQYEMRHRFFEKEIRRRREELRDLLKKLKIELVNVWPEFEMPGDMPQKLIVHPSVPQKNIREGYF
jgi:hypothetical protein